VPFRYELGPETYNSQDALSVEWVNTINRWNNARGLPMGNLNTQNPQLFALDSNGNRIYDRYEAWLLDFSSSTITTLSLQAHRAAILVRSSVTGW
jgi:hypothetical protein